tara:strand:- start:721 stop:1086 length:366 start_codon:yes stop_codon:yes gene_type:complete
MKNYVRCGRCEKIHNVNSKQFNKCKKYIRNKLERGRKDEPLTKNELCPRCKKYCINKTRGMYPAISRRDNKTEICSDCGTAEALFDFQFHLLSKNVDLVDEIEKLANKEKAWLKENKKIYI